LGESEYSESSGTRNLINRRAIARLERLEATAKELSELTKQRCIAAQADVRKPEQLKAAVEKAIKEFSRVDFVVCGAAGNFLAPISGMSENAFRTVIEIDTVRTIIGWASGG
jgi:peroxisomal 2,4-dienoyl-CoA reductase